MNLFIAHIMRHLLILVDDEYSYLMLECPCSRAPEPSVKVEDHSLRRNRVSKKIGCPFRIQLQDRRKEEQAGTIEIKPLSLQHNHAAETEEGFVTARPSMLTSEQRRELETLRVSGTQQTELRKRATQVLQEAYGDDIKFLVSEFI
jgi:hypothetical protein